MSSGLIPTCFYPWGRGATWAEAAGFSPIISEGQRDRIDGLVRAARAHGGEILCGGGRFDHAGSFYRPMLIGGVDAPNPAVTEEIFGPAATFQTFDTEEEVMRPASRPTCGLCAGLFTRDLSRVPRLTRKLEAGTVWVNRYGRSRDHIPPTGGLEGVWPRPKSWPGGVPRRPAHQVGADRCLKEQEHDDPHHRAHPRRRHWHRRD